MSAALPALAEAQAALSDQRLDGWFLYDFRGSNPIFDRLLGHDVSGRLVTRRRFLFIPCVGVPTLLVHSIEAQSHRWPWRFRAYTDHRSLVEELRAAVGTARRIATEYSPGCAIPYASYIDAGTLDVLRSIGFEVVSSENLVQAVLARWSDAALESHAEAARLVDLTLHEAFDQVQAELRAGRSLTEFDVQQFILERFATRSLITAHPPDVAVNAHSANPHYSPSAEASSPIRTGDWLLIDLWARLREAGTIYADVTWVATISSDPTAAQRRIFDVVREARDLALTRIEERCTPGSTVAGWEIDREVRDFITAAGYGHAFTHRTGHSLSPEALHGDGVCLDDFETHDTRLLVPGVGVTIEPGIYLSDFGARSEINVFIGPSGPAVYTPKQEEIVCLPVT